MKILKIFLVVLILTNSSNFLFAQDKTKLSEQEVKSSKKIQFKNRSTLRASEDSKEKNSDIGKSLSISVEKDPAKIQTKNGVSIKRVDVNENGKFGADIFSITANSNFGHINSILRILSAYIQNTFQYKEADADSIALYILYYNAMHRGNSAYSEKKYNKEVNSNLIKSKIGIAKTYSEWPGKTQILIPIEKNILKDKKKDVTIDELEDEVNKVIDKKKDGDKEKKKFDDLVKKKTVEERKQIEKKKDEIQKKEDEIAKKETDSKKREAELKKEPEKNKDEIKKEESKKEEIKKEKETVEKEKKEVQKKEESIAKKEEKIEKKESKKESSGEKSDPKAEEAKKELAVVKKELEKVKEEEKKKNEFDKNVVGGKILFLKTLKYLDQGHYNNELHMLDPEKDDMIFKGDFNNICGRTFEVFSDKVLLIGFNDSHSKNHKLTFVDKDTLKLIKMSDVNVFWRTPLIIKGEELYAFEEENSKIYFSKFDKDLKRLVRSDSEVSPNSNVTFFGAKIYITGKEESSNTDIRVFKKEDLKFIKKIQP